MIFNSQSRLPNALVYGAQLRPVDAVETGQWNGRGHFFAEGGRGDAVVPGGVAGEKRITRGVEFERIPLAGSTLTSEISADCDEHAAGNGLEPV